jgi:dipeptidase
MSSESIIINQCRDWLPDPIGGVMWVALAGGDINLYVPLYAGITRLPEPYTKGIRTKFSWDSAFWIFNLVGSWAQLNYASMIKEIKSAQDRIESAELREQKAIDEEAWSLYQKDPSLARAFLTDYSVNNALKALNHWRELASFLIARYSFGTFDAPYAAPEWWKEAVKKFQKDTKK